MVVFKCVIVYLARDTPAFAMYCVNGASSSSLLKESTDSMIMRVPGEISTQDVPCCTRVKLRFRSGVEL